MSDVNQAFSTQSGTLDAIEKRDEVIQRLMRILNIPIGSQSERPLLGTRIASYLGQQNVDANIEEIKSDLSRVITEYFPELILRDMIAEADMNGRAMIIFTLIYKPTGEMVERMITG